MTRTWTADITVDDMHLNVIFPGPIQTPMFDEGACPIRKSSQMAESQKFDVLLRGALRLPVFIAKLFP